MGHANYSNLCDMWINLLFAKGKLTIGEAVEVAGKRGETLHASEGAYDADSGMVGMALEEYCSFLTCDRRSARDNWGYERGWKGPYIEPILSAWAMRPKGATVPGNVRQVLFHCDKKPKDASLHAVAADGVTEAGYEKWAEYIRDLPKLRAVHKLWDDNDDEYHDGDDLWQFTDRIPWKFCEGKRMQYRDVPRLSNVTH